MHKEIKKLIDCSIELLKDVEKIEKTQGVALGSDLDN